MSKRKWVLVLLLFVSASFLTWWYVTPHFPLVVLDAQLRRGLSTENDFQLKLDHPDFYVVELHLVSSGGPPGMVEAPSSEIGVALPEWELWYEGEVIEKGPKVRRGYWSSGNIKIVSLGSFVVASPGTYNFTVHRLDASSVYAWGEPRLIIKVDPTYGERFIVPWLIAVAIWVLVGGGFLLIVAVDFFSNERAEEC